MLNNALIYEKLSQLTGKRISELGHAANMLWIGLGTEVYYFDHHKRQRMVYEYMLHISSPWRITQNQTILLAFHDICTSTNPNGIANPTYYDTQKDKIVSQLKSDPGYVKDISIDAFGGFEIEFSNSLKLEVFISSAELAEHWRLINTVAHEHFVIFEP